MPDFEPLYDGDHERFGPARGQVNVWAAGQGKVELSVEGPLVLDALSLDDLAHWLTRMVKPSIENVNACLDEEDRDAAE